jgi:hypothetical protein
MSRLQSTSPAARRLTVTKLRHKPSSDGPAGWWGESSLLGGRFAAAAKTASKAEQAKPCFIREGIGFRRCLVWISAVASLGFIGSAERVQTQGNQQRTGQTVWPPKLSAPAAGEVQVLPVQGKVYMLVGAGGNITVQAGDDGVLLVDTGLASMSDKVLAAIKTISTRPLRYIINTTEREDHTGGNGAIADTGEIIPFREPNYTAGRTRYYQGFCDLVSHCV